MVRGIAASAFLGTTGDDRIVGSGFADEFNMSQGGNDVVDGSGGSDSFYFGNTFNTKDQVIGGSGEDELRISGTTTLTISATMMTGVELLSVELGVGASRQLRIASDVTNENGYLVIGVQGDHANAKISAAGSALAIGFYATDGICAFQGGDGNDYFRFMTGGTARFDGGAGYNRVSFFGVEGGVTIDLSLTGAQSVGGGSVALANVADLSGTVEADMLRGSDATNWILANGGNDVVQGLGGDDLLSIGAGFDQLLPTRAYVDGGTGIDLIGFQLELQPTGGVHVALANRGYQDTGQGVFRILNVENVCGTQFDDTITGDKRYNILYGSTGSDVIGGGVGNDELFGDSYLDIVTINGFDGPSIVRNPGSDDSDRLSGDSGNDTLWGQGGSDWLYGGSGKDTLYGGEGNDRFVYMSVDDSHGKAIDTIADFTFGDLIDVSAIDPDTLTPGDQSFHFGATAGHKGDVTAAFDAATNVTNVLFYVDGDARPDMLVKLAGNVALDASSFVF